MKHRGKRRTKFSQEQDNGAVDDDGALPLSQPPQRGAMELTILPKKKPVHKEDTQKRSHRDPEAITSAVADDLLFEEEDQVSVRPGAVEVEGTRSGV